jgi:hypothetical protein
MASICLVVISVRLVVNIVRPVVSIMHAAVTREELVLGSPDSAPASALLLLFYQATGI